MPHNIFESPLGISNSRTENEIRTKEAKTDLERKKQDGHKEEDRQGEL